ncbi:MAG: molybdopterin dinucleotide binding domain-containing protein, partial [Myxococcales bacterium]
LMHAVDGPLLPHLREIGDVLTGSRWTAAAELNPRTAAAAGIADGDFIVVESQAGRLRVRAKLYEGVPPDAVRMPVGYGHSAGSAAAGGQGASPREILVADAVNQLGEPSLWSTRVRVEKART